MISSERIDKDLRIPNNTQETGCYFFLKLSQKSIFLKTGLLVTTPNKFYCGQNDTPVQLATFQTVSDGKKIVANAITDKGIETAEDATFATMADNIGKLKLNPFPADKIVASFPTDYNTDDYISVSFDDFPKLSYKYDASTTKSFYYQDAYYSYHSTDYFQVGFRDYYYHRGDERSVIFLWTINLLDYQYPTLSTGPGITVTEDYVYPYTLSVSNFHYSIINNAWVFTFDLNAYTKDNSIRDSEYFYFTDYPNNDKVTVHGSFTVLDTVKISISANPVTVDPILR